MAAAESAELRALLSDVVSQAGLVLESVLVFRQNADRVVRVVVDAAEGTEPVDSDTLARVSRAVSTALDQTDPIEGAYLLEVSTPGAERELTEPRHWRRQIGRPVRVRLRDGGTMEGRLLEAGEESATVDVDGTTVAVAYATVRKARPRIEWGELDEPGGPGPEE